MSEIAAACLGLPEVAALSGPSHAEEVARGIPTAVVVAAREPALANRLQQRFSGRRFRVYTSDDPVGVELGGAVKNVIALAVGISDGLGFGDNTRAALITRGLAEITRLGVALGAHPATFAGLSGMGDLVVTCTSRHQRNAARASGSSEAALAGSSRPWPRAEGVWNCPIAARLAAEQGGPASRARWGPCSPPRRAGRGRGRPDGARRKARTLPLHRAMSPHPTNGIRRAGAAAMLAAVFLGVSPPPAAGRNLLCTTFPLHLFVRNIAQGREGVRIDRLLPASLGCPHHYALTPHDMRRLAAADVLVVNGLGLEEFLGAPLHRVNPDLRVIDSSRGAAATLPAQNLPHGVTRQPAPFASPRPRRELSLHRAEMALADPDGADL